MSWWRYVRQPSAAERRARAAREAVRLSKRGGGLSPVVVEGRTIAQTFWGKAWCENLESYQDFAYRLPRGRSYVRARAVLDLKVAAGEVKALVSGTSLYRVQIKVRPLAQAQWTRIKLRCAGEIASVIELLKGRLSDRVMELITHREEGLFPKPTEIEMSCSCPDWATMCKHVAAALYGVGARLDAEPQLLFTLRGANHTELISQMPALQVSRRSPGRKTLAASDVAEVFGIELDSAAARSEAARGTGGSKASSSARGADAAEISTAIRARRARRGEPKILDGKRERRTRGGRTMGREGAAKSTPNRPLPRVQARRPKALR